MCAAPSRAIGQKLPSISPTISSTMVKITSPQRNQEEWVETVSSLIFFISTFLKLRGSLFLRVAPNRRRRERLGRWVEVEDAQTSGFLENIFLRKDSIFVEL